MALVTISAADLEGKGVIPLPDVPGLSADDMKYKFEQIIREVIIPAFNENMETLNAVVFIDPETGSSYLTLQSIIASYSAVIDSRDPTKVPSVTAIGEMDSSLKQLIATLSGIVTSVGNRVAALEITIDTPIIGLSAVVSALSTNYTALANRVTALENTVYVVFRANGGTGTMAQVTRIPDESDEITLPSTQSFSREGYTFNGWALSSDGAKDFDLGDTVSDVSLLLAGKVLELFAVWEEDQEEP